MPDSSGSWLSLDEARSQNVCPCGSGGPLGACCEPIFRRKAQAQTAEQLMRARYTAFALGEIDFILDSHHSRTRGDLKRQEVENWSKGSKWLGLRVLETRQGAVDDSEGVVRFHARYHSDGKDYDHFEHSVFERENGQWKFLDAHGLQNGPIRREGPKVGRNDPCHCGSGQKFKKCHGK